MSKYFAAAACSFDKLKKCFLSVFILYRAVPVVEQCTGALLSVTELYVNVRAAFQIGFYKRSQQFRLFPVLLNELTIALKVIV